MPAIKSASAMIRKPMFLQEYLTFFMKCFCPVVLFLIIDICSYTRQVCFTNR